MKNGKLRGFVFYTQDYFGDIAVRLIPMELRGIWIEAFFLMDQSPRRGVLLKKTGEPYSISELAQAMNCDPDLIEKAFHYVVQNGIATIDGRTKALMNRRMVREEKRNKINAKNAQKGGNPLLLARSLQKAQAQSDIRKVIPKPDPDPDPDPDLSLIDSPRPVHIHVRATGFHLGEFGHVCLTADQSDKLKAKLDGNFDDYVNRLDRWGEEEPVKFKKKKSHYATILNWFDRDVKDGKVRINHVVDETAGLQQIRDIFRKKS